MELRQQIAKLEGQVLTHQLLSSMLTHYKRPNDKIHEMIAAGILEPVKKGLYVPGPVLHLDKPEPFLLANHIYGPSYVSLDSALSFHGFIPERVFLHSSVTPKKSRDFHTLQGNFSYTNLSLPYFAFGYISTELASKQVVLVATPEKALFDKIITTTAMILRSEKETRDWLLDNLRIDEDRLRQLDIATMESWIPYASKKTSLETTVKTLRQL